MRAENEPGWRLAAMNCPSGRRGIWYRRLTDGALQLCAGREGDDEFVELRVNEVLTSDRLDDVLDVMEYGSWALCMAGEEGSPSAQEIAARLDMEGKWCREAGQWHRDVGNDESDCGLALTDDGSGLYDRGPVCPTCARGEATVTAAGLGGSTAAD